MWTEHVHDAPTLCVGTGHKNLAEVLAHAFVELIVDPFDHTQSLFLRAVLLGADTKKLQYVTELITGLVAAVDNFLDSPIAEVF